MFEKASASLNFVEREREISAFWREADIVRRSFAQQEGRPSYVFYDGPPTANGMPHIGHVLTRAFKDIVPRYHRMKGCNVVCKAGWDTHGLPVELEVEKQLGISGKPQIEEYGIAPFIEQCKQSVWKYKSEWERMSEAVAFWADMENPYITYENNYIESVWWSIAKLWEMGLLYQGHKVVPYCPRCGTALSSHEVAQGYKDVREVSAFVRFPVVGQKDTFLLAWTTTPWTLPANVALCVNPKEDYAFAKHQGQTLILANALVAKNLGEEAVVEKVVRGTELLGMAYEPLFEQTRALCDKKAHYVVGDSYVTLEDGAGIVHIAPAFGEDDARVGRENGLPFVQPVNAQGCFGEDFPLISGKFIKDADPVIIEDLKARGLLFAAPPYEHSYPFCWRCDTPLMYYARNTWFVKVTAVKEQLLASNESVNWMPDNIREGRMGNFLNNVIDWGLSRERYWGTPLPIWQCECGHQTAIGSIEALKAASPDCPENIELHRPFIDGVHINCPQCGGLMSRVPEVIDCWYDSGSMPFAQWHFPFENQEKFQEAFPANYICEAVDQTRGWFYVLLAISTLLFGRAPFENCLVLGHVNDKDGYKMSKHKGNVVDPWTVIDVQGADAVRWYFFTGSAPWLPSRFSAEAVAEAQRKFMGTLWNTFSFFMLYAEIDDFDPAIHTEDATRRTVMDQWILSRLQELVDLVDQGLSEYKITETSRAIASFVDDLSNWYVRLCRDRFWGSGMTPDKACAYHTLMTALDTLSRLLAPYTPFLAESIYQKLGRKIKVDAPESVHLCAYPSVDRALIQPELNQQMKITMTYIGAGRSARNLANLKTRQPLANVYIQSKDAPLDAQMQVLLCEELNVEAVHFVAEAAAFTTYKLKPQLRTLGRKYGGLVPGIGAALAELDGNAAMQVLQNGVLKLTVEGQAVELAMEDVLSEQVQQAGYAVCGEQQFTLALDTTLTPELIAKGLVREFISKVQNQRKESGFEVTDRVTIYTKAGDIADTLAAASEEICAAVLADALVFETGTEMREWNLNGHNVEIGLTR